MNTEFSDNREVSEVLDQGKLESVAMVPATAFSHFEPYDPKDSRLVSKVKVLRTLAEDTSEAYIRHFRVKFFNREAGKIKNADADFSVKYDRQQDDLALLAYFEHEGTFWVGVNQLIRPVLATRPPSWFRSDMPSGLAWSLPGVSIATEAGLSGISEAVDKTLTERLGVRVASPSEMLGGSAYPNVSISTECCFFRSVKVSPPVDFDRVTYGTNEFQFRRVKFMPIQEVIDKYFTGEFKDARLLDAVLRFAEQKSLNLNLPLKVSEVSNSIAHPSVRKRILNREQVIEILSTCPTGLGQVCHAELTPSDPPAAAFLNSVRLDVQNVEQNNHVEPSYMIDMIESKGDRVSIGSYFRLDGKLYIAVKRAIRLAIEARNLEPHPVYSDSNIFNLESVGKSLCEDHDSYEELQSTALAAVKQKAGLEPKKDTLTFIGFDHSSASYLSQGTYRFLVEIDPSKKVSNSSPMCEQVDTFYVPVDDILDLVNQGVVRDEHLAISAYLLANLVDTESRNQDQGLVVPDDLMADFHEVVNSGSVIVRWLTQDPVSHDIHNRLRKYKPYRKLISYCENEIGAEPLKLHPDDALVFSALIPVYSILSELGPEELPFHLAHDLRHYPMGDFIPFETNSDGTIKYDIHSQLVAIDYDKYKSACLHHEAEALLYSHFLLPQSFGVTEYEQLLGKASVAGALKQVGVTSLSDARRVIKAIVVDGKVPSEVLNHSKYNDYVRSALVEELLRLHIVFSEHTQILYDNWIEHPNVASTMLRFCDRAFNSSSQHKLFFEESLRQVLKYPEGINPLKRELSKAINFDVRILALRIAHFSEFVRQGNSERKNEVLQLAAEHLSNLHDAYLDLASGLRSIRDSEPSLTNLRLLRQLRRLQSTTVSDARSFLDQLCLDSELIPESESLESRNRLLPFLQPLPFQSVEQVRDRLTELECENR